MKIKVLSMILVFICATACNDENEDAYEKYLPIISELPTYRMTHGEIGLISEDLFTQEAILLRSKDQVIDLFSQSFLKKYPQYLSVDFEKYSLIIASTLMARKVLKRNTYFIYSKKELPPYYELRLFYTLDGTNKLDNHIMEIFGILIDKLETSEEIRLITSISL